MAKSNEHISRNGKAAFYASIWEDLRNAALNCGWALGLHGSLSSDMDIMAMPWVEGAKPVDEMIKSISDCFVDNPFKDTHVIPHFNKPNGRVVYTINIWAEFYLDINIISHKSYEMIETTVVPKADIDHSNCPSWAPTIDSDNKIVRPTIKCKCGKYTDITNHHIHTDGRITASYHHHSGCGWHVFIILKDWDGHEFKPGEKYPA